MLTLTLRHGDDEDLISAVTDSVDTICDITGCRVECKDPAPETLRWDLFFRDDIGEECALSMLMEVESDYPFCVEVAYL